jgi:AcrR family transcriptional regulator
MVQKSPSPSSVASPRRRGRPRAFDPDTALDQAMNVFRAQGLAAASLDDISAATGMNRPSLYGAFGDKRALYLQAYRRYRLKTRDDFAPLMASDAPLSVKLRRILMKALDFYLTGESGPRGCFTVLSAASDAVADPEIRAAVADAIQAMDRAFERLYAGAEAKEELPKGADPKRYARMTTAALHTLSIRARAGLPRSAIEPIINDAVAAICGEKRERSRGRGTSGRRKPGRGQQ